MSRKLQPNGKQMLLTDKELGKVVLELLTAQKFQSALLEYFMKQVPNDDFKPKLLDTFEEIEKMHNGVIATLDTALDRAEGKQGSSNVNE